jgi:hypothetical protein
MSLSKGGGEYPKNEYVVSSTNSYSVMTDVRNVKLEIKEFAAT